MPNQPVDNPPRDAVDDFLAANPDLANMGRMRIEIERILREAQEMGNRRPANQQPVASIRCPICHNMVPVPSRRLGLRTHMAIEHPAELRNQEARQGDAALGRKGPTFRCALCENTFEDLDWYHAHIVHDHAGQ